MVMALDGGMVLEQNDNFDKTLSINITNHKVVNNGVMIENFTSGANNTPHDSNSSTLSPSMNLNMSHMIFVLAFVVPLALILAAINLRANLSWKDTNETRNDNDDWQVSSVKAEKLRLFFAANQCRSKDLLVQTSKDHRVFSKLNSQSFRCCSSSYDVRIGVVAIDADA